MSSWLPCIPAHLDDILQHTAQQALLRRHRLCSQVGAANSSKGLLRRCHSLGICALNQAVTRGLAGSTRQRRSALRERRRWPCGWSREGDAWLVSCSALLESACLQEASTLREVLEKMVITRQLNRGWSAGACLL